MSAVGEPIAAGIALPQLARERRAFLLLADPFTFDAETLMRGLDAGVARQPRKIGGLASGGRQPGENVLYLDDKAYRRAGWSAWRLPATSRVDTLVAQGCRPIGEPMFVTRVERNVIYGLDGRGAARGAAGALRRARASATANSSGTRCSSAS